MNILDYLRQVDNKIAHLNDRGQIEINKNCLEKGSPEIKEQEMKCVIKAALNNFSVPYTSWQQDQGEKEFVTLTSEQTNRLGSMEIVLDPEVLQFEASARKPYYRLRGKAVTEQQAMDIIRRTDWVLRHISKEDRGHDCVGGSCIENSWLITEKCSTGGFGWCHPDGTIGCNEIAAIKYPQWHNFLYEIICYKMAFPYLDLIIAVTDWNEIPDYAMSEEFYMKHKDYGVEENDSDYYDFLDNIAYAIWVHDNKIEIMSPSRAKAKYKEYVELYGLEDTSKYTHYYYKHKEPCNQEEYSKQCFKLNGADPKRVYYKESKVQTLLEYINGLVPNTEIIDTSTPGQMKIDVEEINYGVCRLGMHIYEVLDYIVQHFRKMEKWTEGLPPCQWPPEVQEIMYSDFLIITGEDEQLMRSIQIIEDEEVRFFDFYTKYPYYRFRGKPVTPEQALEIKQAKHHVINFSNWIHSDGTVGVNGVTTKYPTWAEFLLEMFNYIIASPHLDFVIALTEWENYPDYVWDDRSKEEKVDSDYPDFLESIVYGIWVHDQTIEFMEPGRAKAKYQEYVALYGVEDTSRYIGRWRKGL